MEIKRFTRYISVIIAALIIVLLIPTVCFDAYGSDDIDEYEAQEGHDNTVIVDSGTCGDNVSWELDEEGTLTISGTGTMTDYSSSSTPFYESTAIEKVLIKEGVTSIGVYVFNKCKNIKSCTIPASVTKIGSDAFNGCSSLTDITIPDSVTVIGDSAFSNCKALTSMSIPKGITTIPAGMFYYCTGLTSVTIPNNVTFIDASAFYSCRSLTSITLPDGLKEIGDYGFCLCSGLTGITLPDSLRNIGEYAFTGCSGITNVTIPDNVITIKSYAFKNCSDLTSITIPEGIASINDSVFSGCSKLTGIRIPDSVSNIGKSAFYGCSELTGIIIPDKVSSIGERAFSGCKSLTSITIPVGVSTIDYRTFSGCSGLKSIIIPDTVTSIVDYAFSGCSELTDIVIPETVTSIGQYVFEGCSSLTSIIIPDSVTFIGEGIFNECSNLTSITLSEGLTYISASAFYSCSSLTNIVIPDSVNEIKVSAFYGCSNLTSVTIPDSVTTIGQNAFMDCISLSDVYYDGSEQQWSSITISGGNGYLESAAIHYKTIEPNSVGGVLREEDGWKINWEVTYYDQEDKQAKLHIKLDGYDPGNKGPIFAGSEIDNGRTMPWLTEEYGFKKTDFVELSIEGNEHCTLSTVNEQFTEYTNLEKLSLKYVERIDSDTFLYCTNMREISVDDSITTICENAFSGTSITDFEFTNVNTIGNYAFAGCRLGTITLGRNVKSIGEGAFLAGNVVIRCYEDSAAHKYAVNEGVKYELIEEPFTLCGITYSHGLDYYAENMSTNTFNNDLCSLMAAIANSMGSRSKQEEMYKILGFKSGEYDLTTYDDYENNNDEIRDRITYSFGKRTNGKGTTIVLIDVKGTEGLSDIAHDINVTNFNDDNYMYHSGFKKAEEMLMLDLKNYLGGIPEYEENTKYFVTGHSLGAATANLVAAELSRLVGKGSVFNYNFACPNTVTSTTSVVEDPSAFNPSDTHSNMFNISRDSDVVPSLPGLGSSALLDAKEFKQYGWDLFQCFHTKHDYYWGKWGITKYFHDEHLIALDAHDMGNYLEYVSGSNPRYSSTLNYGDAVTHVTNDVFIFCPVDVRVVDDKDNVLAEVIDNKIYYYDNSFGKVIISTCDDMKCVSCIDNRYNVILSATDNGTMDYVVTKRSENADEFEISMAFQNVELSTGKTMYGVVSEDASETGLYVLNSEGDVIAEIQSDGTEKVVEDHECEHVWNTSYTVDMPATCTSEGKESIHCTVCGLAKEGSSQVIPKTAHTYGKWAATTPATEINAGIYTRTCTKCGNTETKPIAMLKPTLKSVKILKPKAATIKWKKVTKKNLKKIKKVQIQYSTDKSFKTGVKTKYASAKKTSYKIKGLKKGKKYYVRIRAYTKSGSTVHVSKWSTKKPITIK